MEDHNVNEESVTECLISAVSGKNVDAPDITTTGNRVHVLDGLRAIARESGLWISGGGMHVSGAPPDEETGNTRVFNTHVILDDQGTVQAIYRKIHLFDVTIPEKVQLRESKTTAPGSKLVVCDSPIGT
jgi:predicted amidohydrolase